MEWLQGLDDESINPSCHPDTQKIWTKQQILDHFWVLHPALKPKPSPGQRANAGAAAAAPTAAEPKQPDIDYSVATFYEVDWFELASQYKQELAPTTDKFWPAKFAKGDYHKNMDHHAFFKWMVSVFITYPLWSQEQQQILDRQRELCVPEVDLLSKFDYYDWIEKRPTRSLDMYMDNAPYHAYGSSHITSMTKEQIASMLRYLDLKSIIVGDSEYCVPTCDEKWKAGKPSASDLQASVIELFKSDARLSHLVEPPYMILVNEVNSAFLWGSGRRPGWTIKFSAPYCPEFVAKELHWADAKNDLANPAKRGQTDPYNLAYGISLNFVYFYLNTFQQFLILNSYYYNYYYIY
jgi:hypothetical protein